LYKLYASPKQDAAGCVEAVPLKNAFNGKLSHTYLMVDILLDGRVYFTVFLFGAAVTPELLNNIEGFVVMVL
jgi:hypothetical protein